MYILVRSRESGLATYQQFCCAGWITSFVSVACGRQIGVFDGKILE